MTETIKDESLDAEQYLDDARLEELYAELRRILAAQYENGEVAIESWRVQIEEMEEAQSKGINRLVDSHVSIEEYLNVAAEYLEYLSAMQRLLETIIGTVDWLSTTEVRSEILKRTYDKLTQRRRGIVQNASRSGEQRIRAVFPDKLAEVNPPTGSQSPIPRVGKWQRDKGLSGTQADQAYMSITREVRESAITDVADELGAMDDPIQFEVELSDLYNYQVDEMLLAVGLEGEDSLDRLNQTISNANEEGDGGADGNPIDRWLRATDEATRALMLSEFKNKRDASLRSARKGIAAHAIPRDVFIEELVDDIVTRYLSEHKDNWTEQVNMVYDQAIADAIDTAARMLSGYMPVGVTQRRGDKQTKSPQTIIQSGNKRDKRNQEQAQKDLEEVREFDVMLPEPEALEVRVKIVEIEGVKLGIAEHVEPSNQQYLDRITNPREVKGLESSHSMARHCAVNGSWKRMPSLANTDRARYPEIKKISKYGRTGLRAYYSLFAPDRVVTPQGLVEGVQAILIFRGACLKADQPEFISKYIGPDAAAARRLGAGD